MSWLHSEDEIPLLVDVTDQEIRGLVDSWSGYFYAHAVSVH